MGGRWGSSSASRRVGAGDAELARDQALLLEAVEALVDGLAVFGADLREQFTSPGRASSSDPEQSLIRSAIRELAADALASMSRRQPRDPGRGTLHPSPLVRELATTAARYRLRGTLVQPGCFGAELSALVVVERLESLALPGRLLHECFGLTHREAQVAALLAERRSNAEIARALGVSAHTARHHTEKVLTKLGVRTRQAVERILRQAAVDTSARS